MHSSQHFSRAVRQVFLVFWILFSLGAVQPVLATQPNPADGWINVNDTPPAQAADPLSKIEAPVLEQMDRQGQADFFVWLESKTDLSGANRLESKVSKGEYVYDTLDRLARESQAGVRAVLDGSGVTYRSYTVVNRIFVEGGSRSLAMILASRPEVQRLTANQTFEIDPMERASVGPAAPQGTGSNLSFIKADQVWALGYTGQGIVIGDLDTGLQWDHPALKTHYRGWNGSSADHNYNWYDPTGTFPTAPGDITDPTAEGYGHGTHTAGTLVGDDGAGNQTGVAPGAKLIACKAFSPQNTTAAVILACLDWFLAPRDLNGANPRPDRAPDVINNSWGTKTPGGGFSDFAGAVNALQAAGILVEFSGGNFGPLCQTLSSPGDYGGVLTSGSVGYSGTSFPGVLSTFSSRGPSVLTPETKPVVMAPGEEILSSMPGDQYKKMSGTSMASPHVAGLVALLWSAAPGLRHHIPETIQAITSKAVPLAGQAGSSCGGNTTTGPNNDWGSGTIDALATILPYLQGTLKGKVTDARDAAPLAGVTITAAVSGPANPDDARLAEAGSMTTTSGPDGSYSLTLLNGTYTVTASKSGYLPQSAAGVAIPAQGSATANFTLSLAPPAAIHGTVRDGTPGGHSFPIYTRIDFSAPNLPVVTTYSDPYNGAYQASLYQEMSYTAVFTPVLPGYLAQPASFSIPTNSYTQNFSLARDATACTAPGYRKVNPLFSEGFDGATAPQLPAGWAVYPTVGTTANWSTQMISLHPMGQPPLSPPNLLVFNSYSATQTHAALLYSTRSFDLSGSASAVLTFWMYHDSDFPASHDTLLVYLSTDGSNFAPVSPYFERYRPVPGWSAVEVDLSGYAGPGKPPVYLGFLGTSDYGNDIYLDDIGLSAPCQAIPGGMAGGLVSSASTRLPLNNALVSTPGPAGNQAYSFGTPFDPAQPDGMYLLFSAQTGAVSVTASSRRYAAGSRSVTIASESLTRQDFALQAALLAASPDPVRQAVPLGGTMTLPLTISNLGAADAAFTLQPAAGPQQLIMQGDRASPGNEEAAQAGTGQRSWGVMAPFPGRARYGMASAACDIERFYVFGGTGGNGIQAETWMYDPASNTWLAKASMPVALANLRAACIAGKIYLVGGFDGNGFTNNFLIYDTAANTWTAAHQPVITGSPMLVSYNDKLYALGGAVSGGATGLCFVYDPAKASWTQLASLPTPTRNAGALVYQNAIFILGGANTLKVQRYDPASNTWDTSGPGLPGPRVDPITGWYGNKIYLLNGGGNGAELAPYAEGYALDPSQWPGGAWSMLALPIRWPQAGGAYACAANRLWSVGGTIPGAETTLTQYFDANLLCNTYLPPHPWLSLISGGGTIPPGGWSLASLRLDANNPAVSTPGVYQAQVKINSDAADPPDAVPVIMTAFQTSTRVKISPVSATQSAYPGHATSYAFTISNIGTNPDNFTVTWSSAWPVVLDRTTFTGLAPGTSASFTATVTVPPGTGGDSADVLTLKAVPGSSPANLASASAQTFARPYRLFLPVMAR